MTACALEEREIPDMPGYFARADGEVVSRVRYRPRTLVATVGPCGFRTVRLKRGGKSHWRVGTLVALAWLGPNPEGLEVRRLDADPTNDALTNLAYGTAAQVTADHAARAAREEAAGAATHCPEGHRYEPTWLGNWGARLCRTCRTNRVHASPGYRQHKVNWYWSHRDERVQKMRDRRIRLRSQQVSQAV